MNEREQRGLAIAATCNIKRKGGAYLVPSQSASGKRYTVCPHATEPVCTCPDFENGNICKHIFAVECVIKRETAEDGTVTETQSVTMTTTVRRTYKQDWSAYNAAQVNEKAQFQVLLHDLCQRIEEPATPGPGRPRFPLRDAIFAAVFKVYSTLSGRRFISDLRDAHEKGYVRKVASYNSIFKVFEQESTFELLRSLVVASAQPLKSLESSFAVDSSGFSGCRFDRWYDHKFGQHRIKRAWVKAHIMVGVKTNVITAVEIHHKDAGDVTQLPLLLNTATAANFTIKELSADLAYSSTKALQAIADIDATPLIPFKERSQPTRGGIWEKMLHYFCFHREEFDKRYHLRSNVETTFSMIKSKFGDSVRSKTDVAMKNEVLAKLICHNICCLIQSMHEFGVDPAFCGMMAV